MNRQGGSDDQRLRRRAARRRFPVEAGAAQLLALVGLLAVEAVAVVVVLEPVARRLIPWPSRW